MTTLTTVPQPSALGLPEKFSQWRPRQEDALEFLATSKKRVKAICAPTGSGKSPLVVGDALRHPQEPTCIVTENRSLADQYMGDFGETGMVDIRGRANYLCGLHPETDDYTCEHGYASRCPYKGTYECPASAAEMRAAASGLVITNYAKWIHARRFSQGLSHIKRVVFDEGHEAFNALAQAMQVVLHEREIEERLGIGFPPENEAECFPTWKPWAVAARHTCELEMAIAKQRVVTAGHDARPTWVKDYTHLRNLARRLAILATAAANNWVVEELSNGKGYQFDPIQPARYAESALLLNVPDITIVSATLRPKSLHMTGIGNAVSDFREFLSEFNPKRCPIYYSPIADGDHSLRVDSRSGDLSRLWTRLDQIAARRRDRNGLVHSVSYLRRDEILAHSRFASSMLINERGEPPTEMIREFIESYPGGILVSPSVGQGHSFDYQAAEWQFIAKVPFPPPSKVLKARTEQDPEHPHYLTMQKLVQNCGRGMRAADDQCETFICDGHLEWFYPKYAHLAPKSFAQFLTRADTLPAPPPRLA